MKRSELLEAVEEVDNVNAILRQIVASGHNVSVQQIQSNLRGCIERLTDSSGTLRIGLSKKKAPRKTA